MADRGADPAPAGPEATPFVRVVEAPAAATSFTCPLCGSRFTHGTLVCVSCPLNAGCDIVKCPDCGYQFPRTSKLVEWARRLARRARGGAGSGP